MTKAYDKEFLISELHRFVHKNSRVPTRLDMQGKFGYPSYGTYVNYFGTWNNALIVAGFVINQTQYKLIGLETCCKCGCGKEQTSCWMTKDLSKGQVMCNSCYSNPDYKRGNLDKNSSRGKATISEQIVKNVLNLEEKHDCNFACGFNHPIDLYHKDRYWAINVKDSKLHDRVSQNPYWFFDLSQKIIPDTYVMLGYDNDRKNIIYVWISHSIDDLVFDSEKMEYKESLTITNSYKVLKKAEPWEVDAKPYNDMLHKMSEKRKETNGKECFLRNNDLEE